MNRQQDHAPESLLAELAPVEAPETLYLHHLPEVAMSAVDELIAEEETALRDLERAMSRLAKARVKAWSFARSEWSPEEIKDAKAAVANGGAS